MVNSRPARLVRLSLRRRGVAMLVAIGLAATVVAAGGVGASAGPTGPKPTIVLVHGAFADASGWNDVTARLRSKGYPVLAPANPLRSVDGDAAYLRSVLDTIEGPIVLVGHSYGGFVMTNAAAGNSNVRALVYVAGFAPAAGDTVAGLTAMNPGSGLADPANLVVRHHPAGADVYINPAVFREVSAADVPPPVADVMAASQRPADVATLGQPSGAPAWNDIPSWYVVASQDGIIPPATQRFMAGRAGATTVEIRASHVVMISQPQRVVSIIEDAVAATP